ncbi:colon cancer-associated protein mic1 [Anaeramoeba flamelloides]|uniref:Colon cancer-associated protein mic1 n=1 Tax=Anaeramoeba flamelloides TaxID=1746091 RepID=A0AAV7Y9X2_9EUKA|nr:colon cancer-associated protein mic1 [Anaeramoeba flamelloides]
MSNKPLNVINFSKTIDVDPENLQYLGFDTGINSMVILKKNRIYTKNFYGKTTKYCKIDIEREDQITDIRFSPNKKRSSNQLLLLSTGKNGSTIIPLQFILKQFLKLKSFETDSCPMGALASIAGLKGVSNSQKKNKHFKCSARNQSAFSKNLIITNLYNKLQVIQLIKTRSDSKINLYHLGRAEIKKSTLKTKKLGRFFYLTIIDNLLIIHNTESKTSSMYDLNAQIKSKILISQNLTIDDKWAIIKTDDRKKKKLNKNSTTRKSKKEKKKKKNKEESKKNQDQNDSKTSVEIQKKSENGKGGKTKQIIEITKRNDIQLYQKDWNYISPNIIVDIKGGFAWFVSIDFQKLALQIPDPDLCFSFLLRRSDCKLILLQILKQILSKNVNLVFLSRLFDLLNSRWSSKLLKNYMQLENTSDSFSSSHNNNNSGGGGGNSSSSSSSNHNVNNSSNKQKNDDDENKNNKKNTDINNNEKGINIKSDNNIKENENKKNKETKQKKDNGKENGNEENKEKNKKKIMEKNQKKENDNNNVNNNKQNTKKEEKKDRKINKENSKLKIKKLNKTDEKRIITQENLFKYVFKPLNEDPKIKSQYLVSILFEYIKSLQIFNFPIQPFLGDMIINLLYQDQRFFLIHQFIKSNVIDNSNEWVNILIQFSKKYNEIIGLIFDQFKISKKKNHIISLILENGNILQLLKLIQKSEIDQEMISKIFLKINQLNDDFLFITVFDYLKDILIYEDCKQYQRKYHELTTSNYSFFI